MPTNAEVIEEHLNFLDALQKSGATNMFGAPPFVAERFGVDSATAKRIVVHWMETYTDRHEPEKAAINE